ncbi:dienelactone hydrolase family protein [Phenylobacterium sp. LjRoot219]|uniref:dienelactone hydrolase family protein n=1 Tax=Phenylobacterium sp. LjRoot219 TaxID=3342283 RepID=UPI003ED08D51
MGKVIRWILAGLGLTLLVVVIAVAVTWYVLIAHPRFLEPSARASHAQMMASGLKLVTPPGPGPFPTVLLIHGCGGLHGEGGRPNPIMDEYARSAVEAGWAAGILDSYGPRGWEATWARHRVCTGARLQGFRRAADVLAGLDLLQVDPRVDRHRLRIASWSHGGWAVGDLVTLSDPGDGSLSRTMADVEGVWFSYPFCAFPAQGGRRDWQWKGLVRMVFAELDTVQPAAGCLPLVERAREAGSKVDMEIVPGVTHAFDERVKSSDSTFRFAPAAAARTHAEFIAWLQSPPLAR